MGMGFAPTWLRRVSPFPLLHKTTLTNDCKGDSHSFKTANIILPRLMIKQRWTSLRLQAKWYSISLNCIMLV